MMHKKTDVSRKKKKTLLHFTKLCSSDLKHVYQIVHISSCWPCHLVFHALPRGNNSPKNLIFPSTCVKVQSACFWNIVASLTSRDICTVGGTLQSPLRLPEGRGGWQGGAGDPPGGPPGGPSSPAGTSWQGLSGGPSLLYGPSPPSVTAFWPHFDSSRFREPPACHQNTLPPFLVPPLKWEYKYTNTQIHKYTNTQIYKYKSRWHLPVSMDMSLNIQGVSLVPPEKVKVWKT